MITMSRSVLLIATVVGLLCPKRVAIPPPPSPPKYPVAKSLNVDDHQKETAMMVERRMRDHGFSDELIAAALVNAYAESELNSHAIGKAGERGIFQLHPEGLGHGMSINEMQDIRTSVDRIAKAIKKNKRMMKLEASQASTAEHTAAFCVEIERPSNKHEKARRRVRLMKKMLIN